MTLKDLPDDMKKIEIFQDRKPDVLDNLYTYIRNHLAHNKNRGLEVEKGFNKNYLLIGVLVIFGIFFINEGVVVNKNYGTVNVSSKGNNYLEESPHSSVVKISKSYDNYNIELKGKVKISKKFKPFRVSIENEDPDDPQEWAYKKTLNMKKPFYTLNTEIMSYVEFNKDSHVIYDRCTVNGKKCNEIDGYIYRIKITNITDFGEDIIIRNKVRSSIIRKGDADRVLTAWGMGGGGDYIKLNKNIPLKEGVQEFKFKDSDYISLRHGESIILAIPYIAKKTGVYLPHISLDIRYANAKGKLKIILPELIVPKIFAWVGFMEGTDEEKLSDLNYDLLGRKKVLSLYWMLFDEETHKVKRFSFSERKLSKNDLIFMGEKYSMLFRNELFALKGAKFKSKLLEKYFKNKFDEFSKFKYEPKISPHKIQLTNIEKYNIKLALEVEKELSK